MERLQVDDTMRVAKSVESEKGKSEMMRQVSSSRNDSVKRRARETSLDHCERALRHSMKRVPFRPRGRFINGHVLATSCKLR